ncbi:MAG: hypothetical protein WDW38_007889 [Sanguina aurantia]
MKHCNARRAPTLAAVLLPAVTTTKPGLTSTPAAAALATGAVAGVTATLRAPCNTHSTPWSSSADARVKKMAARVERANRTNSLAAVAAAHVAAVLTAAAAAAAANNTSTAVTASIPNMAAALRASGTYNSGNVSAEDFLTLLMKVGLLTLNGQAAGTTLQQSTVDAGLLTPHNSPATCFAALQDVMSPPVSHGSGSATGLRCARPPEGCDSVFHNAGFHRIFHHSIYAVYDNTQAIPEYIVHLE